jgi:hypothetical protein
VQGQEFIGLYSWAVRKVLRSKDGKRRGAWPVDKGPFQDRNILVPGEK